MCTNALFTNYTSFHKLPSGQGQLLSSIVFPMRRKNIVPRGKDRYWKYNHLSITNERADSTEGPSHATSSLEVIPVPVLQANIIPEYVSSWYVGHLYFTRKGVHESYSFLQEKVTEEQHYCSCNWNTRGLDFILAL